MDLRAYLMRQLRVLFILLLVREKKKAAGATVKPSKPVPVPPALPKQKPSPFIEIETAIFEKDMKQLINDPFAADVEFQVQGRTIYGHRVVLTSASEMFHRMFLEYENTRKKEKLEGKSKPTTDKKSKEAEESKSKSKTDKKSKPKESPHKEDPAEEEEIPEEFICPVTQDIMSDPVIAQDGHTYERKNISEWVSKHGTSPITREQISKDIIIPNRVLKAQIDQYLEKKGETAVKPVQKKTEENY